VLPVALSLWAFYSGFTGGYLVRTRDTPIRGDVACALAGIGWSAFILLTISSASAFHGLIFHRHIEAGHVIVVVDCLVFWASVAAGYIAGRLWPRSRHGKGAQTISRV